MACKDCEEKAAGADLEERVRLIEQVLLIAAITAAVWVSWSKAVKEA